MHTATIFNIQRFSIHDGPGIRTTVFFKGCNLRCKWCHNPECFTAFPQLEYIQKQCRECGRCIILCPNNAITLQEEGAVTTRLACRNCLACVTACPSGARRKVGEQRSIAWVIDQVIRDQVYYRNSGGGVTLSGGEPLLWPDFVVALLKELKQQGIHTAIESALYVKTEVLEHVLPYIDLWLCDLKVMDSQKHKAATGVSNDLILKHLSYLSQKKVDLLVRIPIIPNVNDDTDNLRDTIRFLKENTTFRKIELLRFHKLGAAKYENLGMDYPAEEYDAVKEEQLEVLKKMIEAHGFICVSN